ETFRKMRAPILSKTGRWLGASALAIMIGLGGGSAFLAATTPMVSAQVQQAAQIDVPAVTPQAGFADLVDAVQPAVVSIVVESDEARPSRMRGSNGREFNFQFPDLPDDHPFKDFFDQFRQFGDGNGQGNQGQGNQDPRQGQPAPRGPQQHMMAAGSGFVISEDGYIVTNNHVVQDATKVTVNFQDGTERTATVIGTDERTDLAVVKVDATEKLPFVKLSDTDVRVGEWVVAVGNPFGLGGTVTAGIVSARGRDIAGSAYGDFLQIDAAVNTGNSGGPAFNLNGDVVGVNTAIFSPNGGNVGIAFAIPSNIVKQVTTQLIAHGSVTRGFLGVGIQDVNRDLADSVGLKDAKGALVTEPSAGGPAEKAGVKSGDVIVNVDGKAIQDALDLSRTIASKDPGTPVTLGVWRDGKEQSMQVTLDTLKDTQQAAVEQPAQPETPAAPTPSSVGITLVPNSAGEGLLIQDIDGASVAAEKGLQVGDAILEVDNQKVATADEFEKAISAVKDSGRGTALIKAQRDGNSRFIGLPLTATN
ncbi:MAG TPA: Do family serine endopeptidase, partial [Devosia sp.]|nr:Do family serine endopeptidase [Devosia sp.]